MFKKMILFMSLVSGFCVGDQNNIKDKFENLSVKCLLRKAQLANSDIDNYQKYMLPQCIYFDDTLSNQKHVFFITSHDDKNFWYMHSFVNNGFYEIYTCNIKHDNNEMIVSMFTSVDDVVLPNVTRSNIIQNSNLHTLIMMNEAYMKTKNTEFKYDNFLYSLDSIGKVYVDSLNKKKTTEL